MLRWAIALSLLISGVAVYADEPYQLGAAKGPYFLCDDRVTEDRWLVERFSVSPVPHAKNPLVVRDKAWEGTGPHSGGTVLFDPESKKFLMWYSVWNSHAYYNQLPFSYNVCYAESKDGYTWEKPDLGVFNYEGSTANNIIKLGTDKTQNIDVCLNPKPGVWPGRFLAVHNQKGGIFLSHSDDGKTFTFDLQSPVLSYHSDTHNNIEYDEVRDHWFLYCRPRAYAGYHKRRVSMQESADLKAWTHDHTILVPGETGANEFYGMVVFRRGDLFWGLLQRYDKSTGYMDTELAWSGDGRDWELLPKHLAFTERGKEGAWDAGMVIPIAPVFVDDEIRFYYGGFPFSHDTDKENVGAIGLMVSQRDRLIGIRPLGAEPGVALTRPVPTNGHGLVLNARVRGAIRCELRTDNNKKIPGFTVEDCDAVTGDGFALPVTWKGKLLDDSPEPYARVFFELKDADLFAFDLVSR